MQRQKGRPSRERGDMKRVADEHGVEEERKTTGTVSENRIRGEQVTGGRDPVGRSQG